MGRLNLRFAGSNDAAGRSDRHTIGILRVIGMTDSQRGIPRFKADAIRRTIAQITAQSDVDSTQAVSVIFRNATLIPVMAACRAVARWLVFCSVCSIVACVRNMA